MQADFVPFSHVDNISYIADQCTAITKQVPVDLSKNVYTSNLFLIDNCSVLPYNLLVSPLFHLECLFQSFSYPERLQIFWA